MSERFGEWYRDDDWWIRHEKTTRPLRRVREETAIGLTAGLMGLVTWSDEWKGNELRVNSLGVDGLVIYEPGKITCRLKIGPTLRFMLRRCWLMSAA